MTINRNWTKTALALALTLAPVGIAAQSLGINSSDGETFLKAIEEGDNNKAIPLLEQSSSRVVNYKGYKGDTALHIATRKRDLLWVGHLLKKGADSRIADSNGNTPLMIAASIGFVEAADYMIRFGKAEVNAANRQGETALAIAVQQRQTRMVELLLKAGADPNKPDRVTGYTPYDYAKRDTRNPQLLKLIETVKPTKKPVSGPTIK